MIKVWIGPVSWGFKWKYDVRPTEVDEDMAHWLYLNDACHDGCVWAFRNCDNLVDMWDKLIESGRGHWFAWVCSRMGVWGKVTRAVDRDPSSWWVTAEVLREHADKLKELNPWRK